MDGEKKQLIDNEAKEKVEEAGKGETDSKGNDNNEENAIEEEYDPDKHGAGPIKDRSCTDVLCLGLLIGFCVLWVMIAMWGFQHGDPSKLMYPTDSYGDICGQGDFSNKPYLMFFDLTKCISLTAIAGCPTPQVCVEKCPKENYSPWLESQIPVTGLAESLLGDDVKTKMRPYCTSDTNDDLFDSLSVSQLLERNYCPPWWVQSSEVLGRCLPSLVKPNVTDNSSNNTVFSDSPSGAISLDTLEEAAQALTKALGLRSIGDKIIADLMASWQFIVCGMFLSMLICLLWIVSMRWTAGVLVWTSMLGTMIVLTFVTNNAYTKYSSMPEDETPFPWSLNPGDYLERKGTWFFILCLSGGFLAILMLLTVTMRNRVAIAIELIEEGSVACSQMLCTLFFPPVPFLLQGVVLMWGMLVGVYLLTSSSREYRVVMQPEDDRLLDCGDSCWNPETNSSFSLGEECTQWVNNFTSVDILHTMNKNLSFMSV